MLELPEFSLLKRQPHAPHVASVVATRDVPNEYGTAITYTVRQGRNGKDWWIDAALDGLRMSDTLHTAKPATGAEWIRAVETGKVCVGSATKKTAAQLEREVQESLARLDAKRNRRGW